MLMDSAQQGGVPEMLLCWMESAGTSPGGVGLWATAGRVEKAANWQKRRTFRRRCLDCFTAPKSLAPLANGVWGNLCHPGLLDDGKAIALTARLSARAEAPNPSPRAGEEL